MTPICHYCHERFPSWRAAMWHLVADHERTLRTALDRRYGLAVVDPEDANIADLTEPQARELIAALAGLPPGTDPSQLRAPRHLACANCHEYRVNYGSGLCRSCWRRAAVATRDAA